jgi:hypothetical protein
VRRSLPMHKVRPALLEIRNSHRGTHDESRPATNMLRSRDAEHRVDRLWKQDNAAGIK